MARSSTRRTRTAFSWPPTPSHSRRRKGCGAAGGGRSPPTLEDAKGLLRAGVDAFAHSVRDRDVDDEFMALVKQHPNLVVNPNLPDRGVKTDVSWLRASLPAAEFQKLEEGNTDNPKAQTAHGIQARKLAKLTAAGVKMADGTDGNSP